MSEIPVVPADGRGIARAVAALAAGRLVIHPTETVVSLGGDPESALAVEAARRVKGYGRSRPFLCLVPGVEVVRELALRWSPAAERLTAAFWPGPLTLVVPVAEGVYPHVAQAGKLALRAVADPVSRRLVGAWGGAIFSTSANRRGDEPAVRVREAVSRLADAPGAAAIGLALDRSPAPEGVGIPTTDRPSTIVDVSGDVPRLVRDGALGLERLREAVPDFPQGLLGTALATSLGGMSVPRPYRLLVVCTGNTCRSPMGEALLRRLLDEARIEAEVRSAGTHAARGWPAHPLASSVARDAGLDLSSHRSQPLTSELLRWCDTVLCMSRGHVSRVRELDDAADVRLVTDFDPDPDSDEVVDPIGQEREVYVRSFAAIRSSLEGFVAGLARGVPGG